MDVNQDGMNLSWGDVQVNFFSSTSFLSIFGTKVNVLEMSIADFL